MHLDRDDIADVAPTARIRRQVMEITAVAPTLSADQTYEPIFVREGARPAAGVDGRAAGRARAAQSTARFPTVSACARSLERSRGRQS